MAIYAPIVIYCLRLFYKNYIVFQIVVVITAPSFIALHLLVPEIAKCIASGCLLLFYKNDIVY